VDISDNYLRTQGLDYRFQYTNPNSDNNPPTLTAFSMGSLVYAVSGQIGVPIKLAVADDRSGVNQGDAVIEFTSPTGASIQQRIYLSEGAWEDTFWLPASSPEGEYLLNTIRILDNAGNLNMNYGSVLKQAGFATTVSIKNNPNQDTSPPTLKGLSIDTTVSEAGNPELLIRIRADDLQSGLKYALIRMRDTATGAIYDKYLATSSATDVALAPANSIVLGSDATRGKYQVDFIVLIDQANNEVRLSGKDLASAGFQQEVTFPPAMPVATLTESFLNVTEGNSGVKQLVFTVALSSSATVATTVNYSVKAGTASEGSDYRSGNGTIHFAVGEKTKTFSINILGDLEFEADEVFFVSLSGAIGATLGKQGAASTTVEIKNDDLPTSTYNLVSDAAIVREGDSVRLTFATSNVPAGTSFAYRLSGISSADIYGAPLSGILTTNDKGIATLVLGITSDVRTEGNEELVVTVSMENRTVAVSAPITILDTSINDIIPPPPPVVLVALDEQSRITGNRASLSGTAEPDALISVFDGAHLIGTTRSDTQGAWKFQTTPIADGRYRYAVTATDAAGNESVRTETLQFTVVSSLNVQGTSGADKLYRQEGGQHIDGGEGVDTLIVQGDLAQFRLVKSDTRLTLNDYRGSDVLIGVERIQFNDKTIALDLDGVAGQAYRIYSAAFDRAPDLPGLGYWIKAMDAGTNLRSVAQGFIDSQEFRVAYAGTTSNTALVTKFYQNVLGRAPDSGGISFWVGLLDRKVIDVAEALVAFSESSENKDVVIELIGNGIEYVPYG